MAASDSISSRMRAASAVRRSKYRTSHSRAARSVSTYAAPSCRAAAVRAPSSSSSRCWRRSDLPLLHHRRTAGSTRRSEKSPRQACQPLLEPRDADLSLHPSVAPPARANLLIGSPAPPVHRRLPREAPKIGHGHARSAPTPPRSPPTPRRRIAQRRQRASRFPWRRSPSNVAFELRRRCASSSRYMPRRRPSPLRRSVRRVPFPMRFRALPAARAHAQTFEVVAPGGARARLVRREGEEPLGRLPCLS